MLTDWVPEGTELWLEENEAVVMTTDGTKAVGIGLAKNLRRS